MAGRYLFQLRGIVLLFVLTPTLFLPLLLCKKRRGERNNIEHFPLLATGDGRERIRMGVLSAIQ